MSCDNQRSTERAAPDRTAANRAGIDACDTASASPGAHKVPAISAGATASQGTPGYEEKGSPPTTFGERPVTPGTPSPGTPGGLITGDQPVYTATGPRTARDLAESGEPFVGLVHDAGLGRYAAHEMRVIAVGEGAAHAVTAKGDTFCVGASAAFELAQRGRISVVDLIPGRRILACTTNRQSGYVRVNLRDGNKGRELLHRLVASDVMGIDIKGRVIHHEDHDKLNNDPGNLRPLEGQSEHASIHVRKLVAAGEHPFQLNTYPKVGEDNPMHKDGAFWNDTAKAKRYRAKKRQEMLDRDPVALQKASTRRRTLNTGHRIRNAGYTFSSMEEYIAAHETVIGRIGNKNSKRNSITRQFGSIQGFVAALDRENHRVEAIECLGTRPLFTVVVSPAGKGSSGAAPIVIWPVGNDSPFGAGVALCPH